MRNLVLIFMLCGILCGDEWKFSTNDYNKTIDEMAKNAKIFGENLDKILGIGAKHFGEFMQNNRKSFKNLENELNELNIKLNGTLEVFKQELNIIGKDLNSTLEKSLKDLNVTQKNELIRL